MVKIADEHKKEWQKIEEEYMLREGKKRETASAKSFYKEMLLFSGRNFKERYDYLKKYLRSFNLNNTKEAFICFKNYLKFLLNFIL